MRAAIDLIARQLQNAVIIFLEQHLLELARALCIASFTEQGRGGFLSHGNG